MYRKTLLAAASVIALGLAASSPAWAEDSNTDQIDESTVDNGSTATNNTDVEEGSNLGNNNTATTTETEADAEEGGIANAGSGTLTSTETENENDAEDGSVAGNNNAVSENEAEAEEGGIANAGSGTVTSTETETETEFEAEAEEGGIANAGSGTVTSTENENEAEDGSVAGNNNAVNELEAEDGGVAIIGGGTVSVSEVEIVSEAELVGVVTENPVITVGGVGIEGSADNATAVITTGNAQGTQSNIGGIGTMQVTSGFNNLQQNSVTISAQGSFTPAANGGAGTSGTN